MNKENQKKFKEYQKLDAQIKKSQAKIDKLYEAYEQATKELAAAMSKVEKKFAPKIQRAYDKMADVRDATEQQRTELSALRKSLIASDNPDRKELIDILIKD
jgi:chromosome segregation ATPase